ncbi:hypothetical protein DL89DRAFT_14048 [Linderina pennispora]|uniref:Uncharacterized protein n=1 Tax=Linderina pennispora TaxID=61395 RepID=A0A1Y1WL92_9FUNG|nr:uncharacterized protein DL89DRAFT_14048 [Linderina pennispora]ORX74327.1 hypothetical protein DL89DRAFT_14048 [Linderina pennispora]
MRRRMLRVACQERARRRRRMCCLRAIDQFRRLCSLPVGRQCWRRKLLWRQQSAGVSCSAKPFPGCWIFPAALSLSAHPPSLHPAAAWPPALHPARPTPRCCAAPAACPLLPALMRSMQTASPAAGRRLTAAGLRTSPHDPA